MSSILADREVSHPKYRPPAVLYLERAEFFMGHCEITKVGIELNEHAQKRQNKEMSFIDIWPLWARFQFIFPAHHDFYMLFSSPSVKL